MLLTKVDEDGQGRASEAEDVNLISDENERAKVEVENGFRQFDAAMDELDIWKSSLNYQLKPSILLSLNRIALERIHPNPGTYRPGKIKIRGSHHKPPNPNDVPRYVEEFCDYVNKNWDRETPIHLAAYAMWRLNWIHPFSDGNGRTSRIVSFLILCAKLGNRLPGTNSIPEQIVANKNPYYKALEAADEASIAENIDVSEMENLLQTYLAKQFVEIHDTATGGQLNEIDHPSSQDRLKIIKVIESHPVVSTFLGAILIALFVWVLG